LNRVIINHIFDKIRRRIAEICEVESPFENGGNRMKATLVRAVFAASEGVAHGEKSLFLGCSRVATRCTPKSLKTAP
jgi:hypothetical protein